MNAVHTEQQLENAIETALLGAGWISGPTNYRDHLALDTGELAIFLGATQGKVWSWLLERYGNEPNKAQAAFGELLAAEIEQRGTLDVLRHGVKDRSVLIHLAYFRPGHTLAAGALDQYHRNRLTVARQLRPFERSEGAPDLTLFLNGIPVATAELKNQGTGSTVEDAKEQYRRRDPREPFFARRTLVHFAVDPELVFVTTRLAGKQTRFLPFNTGSAGPGRDGGAGNPPAPNPDRHQTAYLWEQVWQRDTWLDLLHRFLHVDGKGRRSGGRRGPASARDVIFPRFHQWHAVRELTAHAAEHGAGHNYLVQHSAGSGKSNTIGWLAHRLSSLHSAANEPVFDKIVVITDRLVLDKQLQDTIYQFEHVVGVVQRIEKDSHQLAAALTGQTARIVITTGQKFSFVLEKVNEAGKAEEVAGRRYAIIVDEAHSGQSGENAKDLKRVARAARQRRHRRRRRPTHRRRIGPRSAPQPVLLRLHRHAEAEDGRTLRHPARHGDAAVSHLFDAAGDRRGLHPRRAAQLPDVPDVLAVEERRRRRGQPGRRPA
jgi:type I restriction enzyme R subunit